MNGNGLQSFALHRAKTPGVAGSLRPTIGVALAPEGAASKQTLAALDPESAARRYVDEALAREDLKGFERTEANGHPADFKSLGTEAVGLTGTTTVKFRQVFQRVPVYGSLVTVEMDAGNELVSLNSSLGTPDDVSPVATIAPSDALAVVKRAAGYGAGDELQTVPMLYFYFQMETKRWRLVYITPNVLERSSQPQAARLRLTDFVVDAHSGELVAVLPRTEGMEVPAVEPLRPTGRWRPRHLRPEARPLGEEEAPDGLGRLRRFVCKRVGEVLHMADEALNVHTFDFGFRDLLTESPKLPGEYVALPPKPWVSAGVSAHANAVEVALFLRETLKRDNLDGRGGPIVSSINCEYGGSPSHEWRNAAWIGTQMVYGQRQVEGKLRSYAVALDVVAHEFLHGLTDHTARLVYAGMSGALNESYSDIFGIILSNLGESDVGRWNWEMGEELDATGVPIRDLRTPSLHGQPEHMSDYVNLPSTDDGDWGGVHINSGIHNKAAYNVLTARGPSGRYVFDPRSVAAIFYLALTQHLSRTSQFEDSRRAVELATRSLFRQDPYLQRRVDAIGKAFDDVGIHGGAAAKVMS